MGRDVFYRCHKAEQSDFNPRAPCGARPSDMLDGISGVIFQSTRPVWGATRYQTRDYQAGGFQSTRPVWGATSGHVLRTLSPNLFQSTRPVWGATAARPAPQKSNRFQSTRPVWGATLRYRAKLIVRNCISIHAPRVGRDSKFDDFTPSNLHKRYKRVLARPKNTREKGKIKQKLAYIHAFSAFLGCEGSGTFCALVLRTQYR